MNGQRQKIEYRLQEFDGTREKKVSNFELYFENIKQSPISLRSKEDGGFKMQIVVLNISLFFSDTMKYKAARGPFF